MDNIIHVLPETVINQIAAGEVVVRPSSVVKELIENAIDANAGMIHVEIVDGGRSLIRVLDDGSGMTREDAVLSLERHATSKLRGSEDLQNILTLGFRGEALPSIASVSRFELRTRCDGTDVGVKIAVEGGTKKEIEEIACNMGTEVRVRDLFFNVPARLKFMKTEKTELQHITDLIGTFAIGHRQVLFRLISNGKTLCDFPPDAHLQDRMASVLGRACARRMFPIALDQPVLVRGYISEPTLSKKGTTGIFTFINGRAVYDKLLYQALRSAYGNMLDTGRYPYGVLFLELPPDRIDVNVHPTKNEVRFQSPNEAFQAVHRACAMMLAVAPWKKEMHDTASPMYENMAVIRDPAAAAYDSTAAAQGETVLSQRKKTTVRELPPLHQRRDSSDARREVGTPRQQELPPVSVESPSPADDRGAFFSLLRIHGQMQRRYLICESGEALILLDQHAAHERVTFEKLRHKFNAKSLTSQTLLFPIVIELSLMDARVLADNIGVLAEIGFDIEPFGGNTFAIKGVPDMVQKSNPESVLKDIISEVSQFSKATSFDSIVESVLSTVACHGSIRSGQELSMEECRELLRQLDGIDVNANCPHGRPILVTIPFKELEHRFHRR